MTEEGSSSVVEEKERKKESNITILLTNKDKDKRIPVCHKANPEIHRNFKRFAANIEREIGECYDIAAQEFMVNHRNLLPEKPTFNLIEQPELQAVKLRCTLRGCPNPGVQKAVYLPKNQDHNLCANHVELVLKEERQLWKVLPNE